MVKEIIVLRFSITIIIWKQGHGGDFFSYQKFSLKFDKYKILYIIILFYSFNNDIMTLNKNNNEPKITTLKSSKEYRGDLLETIQWVRSWLNTGKSTKIKEKLKNNLIKTLQKETKKDQEYIESNDLHRREGRKEKQNKLLDKLNSMEKRYNEIINKINKMEKARKDIINALWWSVDIGKMKDKKSFDAYLLAEWIQRIKYTKDVPWIENKENINQKIVYISEQIQELETTYEKIQKQNESLKNKIKKIQSIAKDALNKETPSGKLLKSDFENILQWNDDLVEIGNSLRTSITQEMIDIYDRKNIDHVICVKNFNKRNKEFPNLYIIVRKIGFGTWKNTHRIQIVGKRWIWWPSDNIWESLNWQIKGIETEKIHEISLTEYKEIAKTYEKKINAKISPAHPLYNELYKNVA